MFDSCLSMTTWTVHERETHRHNHFRSTNLAESSSSGIAPRGMSIVDNAPTRQTQPWHVRAQLDTRVRRLTEISMRLCRRRGRISSRSGSQGDKHTSRDRAIGPARPPRRGLTRSVMRHGHVHRVNACLRPMAVLPPFRTRSCCHVVISKTKCAT